MTDAVPAVADLLAQAAGTETSGAEAVVFWVFAVVGVGAGIAMITLRNIVHAALMLVVNLVAIGALYLALQSPFLGVIQVIVYAGAIVVLFLFVIMLLGVDRDDLLVDVGRWHRAGAVGLAGLVGAAAVFAFAGGLTAASRCDAGIPPAAGSTLGCRGLDQALAAADDSSVSLLGDRLFGRYTFPFEVAALLLTVATIGAIVLGRREDRDPDEDPAWAPSGSLLRGRAPDDAGTTAAGDAAGDDPAAEGGSGDGDVRSRGAQDGGTGGEVG